MQLGFKQRFVPMVEDGSKTHTMRGGTRWRAGMRADLYTGPYRPGERRLIFRVIVERVERVEIEVLRPLAANVHDVAAIRIEGVRLVDDEMDVFAWRDGFRPLGVCASSLCLRDMLEYWRDENGLSWRGKKRWSGQIIYWNYAERFTDVSDTCYTLTRAMAFSGVRL
jgi:hypothetical protein